MLAAAGAGVLEELAAVEGVEVQVHHCVRRSSRMVTTPPAMAAAWPEAHPLNVPVDSMEPRRARARTPSRQGELVVPLRGDRLDTLLPCSRSPVQDFVVVTDRFLHAVGFPGTVHSLSPLLFGEFLHGSQVSPDGDHRESAQGPRKQAVGARGRRGLPGAQPREIGATPFLP